MHMTRIRIPAGISSGAEIIKKGIRVIFMKLIIADKLNFLMRITETRNNMLGKVISFDPSYISRIRTGNRGVPKNREFIAPAAEYFAKAIRSDSQKTLVAKHICPGKPWPKDVNKATRLIAGWLKKGIFTEPPALSNYTDEEGNIVSDDSSIPFEYETEFYYGNEGKRKCVLRFLTKLANLNEPVNLLLHSEEDMYWIYEKPNFARRWAQLLIAILNKGGHIVIIHTVRRTLDEMLQAVTKWSPMYATGSIESYYCPRLRDKLFHRTLFIARGISAIIANSVGEFGKNRLNIYVRNKEAVKALEKDYEDFLSICEPLMKVYNSDSFTQFDPILDKFRTDKSTLLHFHTTPSLLSIPDKVTLSLAQRSGYEKLHRSVSQYRSSLYAKRGKTAGPVTDILCLPDIETVTKGAVPFPLADVFGAPSLCYTADEFYSHLAAALHLMKTKDNYTIVLLSPDTLRFVSGNLTLQAFSILASEKTGAVLYSGHTPTTVFYTKQPDMVTAFCECLNHFVKNAEGREVIMAKLQDYLDKLEKAIARKG